ncbi:hypothetical protein BKX93_22195 [Chromobacterium vaccinii]|uniref:Uncharacterized protein n=1 Tax=Chromobacterium vaccinii TaxID=1108595 RepID=A0A1D9LMW0_9NEIS|nr:hypothetical protein BKX93_22195 [Chromobacterium vaccinii]
MSLRGAARASRLGTVKTRREIITVLFARDGSPIARLIAISSLSAVSPMPAIGKIQKCLMWRTMVEKLSLNDARMA